MLQEQKISRLDSASYKKCQHSSESKHKLKPSLRRFSVASNQESTKWDLTCLYLVKWKNGVFSLVKFDNIAAN